MGGIATSSSGLSGNLLTLYSGLHEARHDPETAPLLVWMQGGPGASSMFGALFEHGPCLVKSADETEYNPTSWTEVFNIAYIDSPAGAGFSYHDDPSSPPPNTTDDTAREIVATIELLYEAFPYLSHVPLHIAGESYGGHWVPGVGAAIVGRNEELVSKKRQPLPLKSIMAGNGWVDPVVQTSSLFDVACHQYHGYEPYLGPEACGKMLPHLEPCQAALRECAASRDAKSCSATVPSCQKHITDVILGDNGGTPYDRRIHNCVGDCYQPKYDKLHGYLGRPGFLVEYLELFNASGGYKKEWTPEDMSASPRFIATGDFFSSVTPQLERVLATPSVDVLFYAGAADVSCNPKGVLQALEATQWENQVSLIQAEWEDLPWEKTDGTAAGRAKRVDGLWMVDVYDAGHYVRSAHFYLLNILLTLCQVPFDQPSVALRLVKEWRAYTERAREGSDITFDEL